MLVAGKHAVPQHLESNQITEDIESIKLQFAVRSTISGKASSFRKLRSMSPSPRARSSSPLLKGHYQLPCQFPGKFSFKEKRAVSPLPTSSTLTRSGSLSRKLIVSNLSNIWS